jgi:hypothetical protein
MISDSPTTRGYKPIDPTLGLHEILASVRQRAYMEKHCQELSGSLAQILRHTYCAAPIRNRTKGPIYKLGREEKTDPLVEERLLEKRLWQAWNTTTAASEASFLDEVCHRIQTYQMPLKNARHDKYWGMIDLMGATTTGLPVVIELKRGDARDTPLRAGGGPCLRLRRPKGLGRRQPSRGMGSCNEEKRPGARSRTESNYHTDCAPCTNRLLGHGERFMGDVSYWQGSGRRLGTIQSPS